MASSIGVQYRSKKMKKTSEIRISVYGFHYRDEFSCHAYVTKIPDPVLLALLTIPIFFIVMLSVSYIHVYTISN